MTRPLPVEAMRTDPQTGQVVFRMHTLQSADEVLIRPLEQSGEFELVVGLRGSLSLESLRQLAARTDRRRLIELALSLNSPPT